jgi:hypothetical protein
MRPNSNELHGVHVYETEKDGCRMTQRSIYQHKQVATNKRGVSVWQYRDTGRLTYIHTAAMLQHTANRRCVGCWTNTATILRLYTSSKKNIFTGLLNIISESKRSADQTGHTNTHTHTQTHTHTHTCSNSMLAHRCQSDYTMLHLCKKPACSGNINNAWQNFKT